MTRAHTQPRQHGSQHSYASANEHPARNATSQCPAFELADADALRAPRTAVS
jgi:hypothetical protein